MSLVPFSIIIEFTTNIDSCLTGVIIRNIHLKRAGANVSVTYVHVS
jgi:hypothetical protein